MSKQRNDRLGTTARMSGVRLGYVCAAPWLLAACAGDVVNLGEQENELAVPSYSRCSSSRTLEGAVWVENQEQLDALEGCEVIAGDLDIVAFGSATLRSLHALRNVEGNVRIGGHTPLERSHGVPLVDWTTKIAEYEASIVNWLPSLQGLEHLETADSLQVVAPVSSLEPLAALRRINSGYLKISSNVLESLAGLEGVVGFDSLSISGAELRDISAVRLPETMTSLSIHAPIASVNANDLRSVSLLDLGTELADLNAFQNLESVGELMLVGNGRLRDTEGLNAIVSLDALTVMDNDALEHLCDFAALTQLMYLQIQDNASLTEIPSFPAFYQGDLAPFTDRPYANVEHVDVRGNDSLRQLVLPAAWKVADVVIVDRTNLESIDFVNLQSVATLVVTGNSSLNDVRLGALSRAAYLEVTNNYELPPTAFDAVRTFESHIEDNAPGP